MKVKEAFNYVATWKFWIELLIMTVSMSVAATAVYFFLVPSNLIVGSVTGLSIVLCNISEQFLGIPLALSTVILVINVILLVMAYFLVGKEFGIKTVYTALILGPILRVLEVFFPYEEILMKDGVVQSVMGDPWLDLLAFVIILSASQAILFKINASTGGLDIIGKIINKYLHLDIGVSVSIGGALICCTAFAINPFNLVILGLMGTWINGLVIDYFTAGLNKKKRVRIISPDHERLRQFVLKDLQRGCTLYEVIGGYSNEKKIELEALLTKDEFSSLMNLINTEKIDAFITAEGITEVYGIWASKKKKAALGRKKI